MQHPQVTTNVIGFERWQYFVDEQLVVARCNVVLHAAEACLNDQTACFAFLNVFENLLSDVVWRTPDLQVREKTVEFLQTMFRDIAGNAFVIFVALNFRKLDRKSVV